MNFKKAIFDFMKKKEKQDIPDSFIADVANKSEEFLYSQFPDAINISLYDSFTNKFPLYFHFEVVEDNAEQRAHARVAADGDVTFTYTDRKRFDEMSDNFALDAQAFNQFESLVSEANAFAVPKRPALESMEQAYRTTTLVRKVDVARELAKSYQQRAAQIPSERNKAAEWQEKFYYTLALRAIKQYGIDNGFNVDVTSHMAFGFFDGGKPSFPIVFQFDARRDGEERNMIVSIEQDETTNIEDLSTSFDDDLGEELAFVDKTNPDFMFGEAVNDARDKNFADDIMTNDAEMSILADQFDLSSSPSERSDIAQKLMEMALVRYQADKGSKESENLLDLWSIRFYDSVAAEAIKEYSTRRGKLVDKPIDLENFPLYYTYLIGNRTHTVEVQMNGTAKVIDEAIEDFDSNNLDDSSSSDIQKILILLEEEISRYSLADTSEDGNLARRAVKAVLDELRSMQQGLMYDETDDFLPSIDRIREALTLSGPEVEQFIPMTRVNDLLDRLKESVSNAEENANLRYEIISPHGAEYVKTLHRAINRASILRGKAVDTLTDKVVYDYNK